MCFPLESWVKLSLIKSTSWASKHFIIFTCSLPFSASLLHLPLGPWLRLLGKCFPFLIWLSPAKMNSLSCALCYISRPHLEPCWYTPCSFHLCLLASLSMAILWWSSLDLFCPLPLLGKCLQVIFISEKFSFSGFNLFYLKIKTTKMSLFLKTNIGLLLYSNLQEL